MTDEEVLASVKRGKPPVDCPMLGTWMLRSYVRERLSDGQRHNQFGEAPVGYIAYARTFSLGDNLVVHHIDTSWNQAWTGTDQIRHFVLDGDTLTITTAPYKSYLDGTMGRSILVWNKVR